MTKARIVLWDIETSLMNLQLESFDLRGQDYMSHKSIKDDWYIISIAWKELGKKQIRSVSVLDDLSSYKKNIRNDLHVVKTVREVISNADILVHHNGAAFDLKKFNARLIYHGLPPVDMPLQVDTLKEARKIAKFTSNRLDYLAQHLGYTGKMDSEGLWRLINKGGPEAIKAIKRMVKYNKKDVDILEYVYLKLRPYMKSHPNLNLFKSNEKPVCSNCGSKDLIKNGIRPTITTIKQKYLCKSCGHTTALKMVKSK